MSLYSQLISVHGESVSSAFKDFPAAWSTSDTADLDNEAQTTLSLRNTQKDSIPAE